MRKDVYYDLNGLTEDQLHHLEHITGNSAIFKASKKDFYLGWCYEKERYLLFLIREQTKDRDIIKVDIF